jgi:hypothetical protein
MINDGQLEQMILERNTFEAENIELKKELGDMCQVMINMFNGGWDEEQQRDIDNAARAIIRKNDKHIIKG